jgi:hypothetical protein
MSELEDTVRALEERIKQLEDQQAIYRLVSSYGPAMDTGSGPECGSLWADDGVYEYDDRRAHGPAGVAAMAEAGELWDLDGLAAACAADGRYSALLTVSPLPLVGGVGSPANAIAIR